MSGEQEVQEGEGQEGEGPPGLMKLNRYYMDEGGGTILARWPMEQRLSARLTKADAAIVAAGETERRRVMDSPDLTPIGKERARREVEVRTFAELEKGLAEIDVGATRHAAKVAEAMSLRRLTRVPEVGAQSLDAEQRAYQMQVNLDALRRKRMEGPHAVEAFLLEAARVGDRMAVAAAAYLPPVVQREIVPEGLLPRVAEELHAALEPEEHDRLSALSAYWRQRRSTVEGYQQFLSREWKTINVLAGG